jgi:hypothetical protein
MTTQTVTHTTIHTRRDFFARTRMLPSAIILGGILISIGTFLPWFSFFGGLHTYAGILGLNGRILLGLGITTMLFGSILMKNTSSTFRWILVLLALVTVLFTSWILYGLMQMTSTMSSDPMSLMQPGHGLHVILGGGILTLVTALLFLKK